MHVQSTIRDGILIHSGQWANHSSWRPGRPMPNSGGCVHSYLPDIQQIAELLVRSREQAGTCWRGGRGGGRAEDESRAGLDEQASAVRGERRTCRPDGTAK